MQCKMNVSMQMNQQTPQDGWELEPKAMCASQLKSVGGDI